MPSKKDVTIRKDVRAALLFISFRLFLYQGFADVSINDIVQQAGLTKGGFYHYFKSKDDLVEAVFERYIASYFNNILDIPGEDPHERLRAICGRLNGAAAYLKEVFGEESSNPRQFCLLMTEGIKRYPFIRDFRLSFLSRIRLLIAQVLEEGKRQGLVRPTANADDLALTLLAYSEGMPLLHLIDNEIEIERAVGSSFDQLWAAITA